MADGCSHSPIIVTPHRWWDPSQFPRRLLAWTGNNANRLMAVSTWWLLPSASLLPTLDTSPSLARAFPHSHGPASAACTIMVVSSLTTRPTPLPPNLPSYTPPTCIKMGVPRNLSRTVVTGSALGSCQFQTSRYQIHHTSEATFEPAPDACHCPSLFLGYCSASFHARLVPTSVPARMEGLGHAPRRIQHAASRMLKSSRDSCKLYDRKAQRTSPVTASRCHYYGAAEGIKTTGFKD